MAALAFQPTRAQLLTSWLTFAVCLVAAAWLGGEGRDGFGWALAHDLVQAVGAAALAIGGIGTLVNRLARRRWESATQVIAVDQLHAAVRHAGAVMAAAADVLFGDAEKAERMDRAFQLPLAATRQKVVAELVGEAGPRATEVILGSEDHEVVARLVDRSQELRAHSDALFDAVGELDSFLRGDHVLPLLAEASYLRRRARVLTDCTARTDLDEHTIASRAALAALDVLRSGLAVVGRLREPFDQIRDEVRDPELRQELETDEDRLELDETLERWKRETERQLAEIDRAIEAAREIR
jgi:hypothetical protein